MHHPFIADKAKKATVCDALLFRFKSRFY